MTLKEVMTSLECTMPEVAVKDTIKEGITGLELDVSVHINVQQIVFLNLDTYNILRNKTLVYKTIRLYVHIKETLNR